MKKPSDLEQRAPFNFRDARRALLAWFETNGRELPWRENPTPYRVWVSEIMLQQTTTQTVERYYDRFLQRFPDPNALAEADESEVLAYWEGLGYYRRARAMRGAAIVMRDRFDGRVPDAFDALLALPGVGRYVANAVLSFGLDARAEILEANTTRLHARLLALTEEVGSSAARKILWRFAEDWLPRESARREHGVYRRINSALTDLGRTVCAPRAPKCDECPLRRFCRAFQLGKQHETPVLKSKTPTTPRIDVAFWITRRELEPNCAASRANDVLMTKRPEGALWSGLWDFPRFENLPGADVAQVLNSTTLSERLRFFLSNEVGVDETRGVPGELVATFKHSVTRYRVTLALCRLASGSRALFSFSDADDVEESPIASDASTELKPISSETRWTRVSELGDYPLSSTGREIAKLILARS